MKRDIFRRSYVCKHTVTETNLNPSNCTCGKFLKINDNLCTIFDFFSSVVCSRGDKWRFHLLLEEESDKVDKLRESRPRLNGTYRVKFEENLRGKSFLFSISIRKGLSADCGHDKLCLRTFAIASEYLACYQIYTDIVEDLLECSSYSPLDLASNRDPSYDEVCRLLVSTNSIKSRLYDSSQKTGDDITSYDGFIKSKKDPSSKAYGDYMSAWRENSRVDPMIVSERTISYLLADKIGFAPKSLV